MSFASFIRPTTAAWALQNAASPIYDASSERDVAFGGEYRIHAVLVVKSGEQNVSPPLENMMEMFCTLCTIYVTLCATWFGVAHAMADMPLHRTRSLCCELWLERQIYNWTAPWGHSVWTDPCPTPPLWRRPSVNTPYFTDNCKGSL